MALATAVFPCGFSESVTGAGAEGCNHFKLEKKNEIEVVKELEISTNWSVDLLDFQMAARVGVLSRVTCPVCHPDSCIFKLLVTVSLKIWRLSLTLPIT